VFLDFSEEVVEVELAIGIAFDFFGEFIIDIWGKDIKGGEGSVVDEGDVLVDKWVGVYFLDI